MSAQQTPEQRLAEIVPLYNAMQGMWPLLSAELQRIKADYVTGLIAQDNEQLRGRIKQLEDLLQLNYSLHQEIRIMNESLPEHGGSE